MDQDRFNAVVQELAAQRQYFADRAAALAGELAVQMKKIEEMSKPKEDGNG